MNNFVIILMKIPFNIRPLKAINTICYIFIVMQLISLSLLLCQPFSVTGSNLLFSNRKIDKEALLNLSYSLTMITNWKSNQNQHHLWPLPSTIAITPSPITRFILNQVRVILIAMTRDRLAVQALCNYKEILMTCFIFSSFVFSAFLTVSSKVHPRR